jgi:hypothetical protein
MVIGRECVEAGPFCGLGHGDESLERERRVVECHHRQVDPEAHGASLEETIERGEHLPDRR